VAVAWPIIKDFLLRRFYAVMSTVRLGFKNKAKTNPKYNFEA